MEESTCHEMVIDLRIKAIQLYEMLFLHLFISFKYDFHVDAERMIVRT